MPSFHVADMTCAGCVKAITGAVHDLDATATVACDLETRFVEVASSAPADALTEAIRDAGFTVTKN